MEEPIKDVVEVLPEKAERFLDLFQKKMCNVSQACTALNMSRQTYYDWLDKFDTFKKRIEDIQESFYDNLESKLFKKAMVDEDNTMLIFLAKTKMKHRGYIERVEQSVMVQEEQPLFPNITYDK
jgi:L-lactate utilization protein LutB